MKLSTNWLKNYVNLPSTPEEIEKIFETFTTHCAEIENIEHLGKNLDKVVIGKILSINPHPSADKLRITQTSVGTETLQIVCGASNIYENQLVAVALIGAQVKWHGQGDLVTISPTKIRDVQSFGMICAGEEIGLQPTPDGILDLSYLNIEPGTPLADCLNQKDSIIEIDNKTITHRPDLWGHFGIAREIAAITKQKLRPPQFFNSYPFRKHQKFEVAIQDNTLCPRYQYVHITDIKIAPSPQWLKTALTNIGLKPINNVVDIANFVMYELGQPLHTFDSSKINGKIIVRSSQKNEKITTLDGKTHTLPENTILITDQSKILAIAGIMGGQNSETSSETTEILVESANFNAINIRKTSKILNLRTDAVQRFEKYLDPHLTTDALDRFCQLLSEIIPSAKISSEPFDFFPNPPKPSFINLNLPNASNQIGINFTKESVTESLTPLGFNIKSGKENLKIEIPSWRATNDILAEEDLIEELARIYGYDKLPETPPKLSATLPIPNHEHQNKYFLRSLISNKYGFNEVLNYSFISEKKIQNLLMNPETHIALENYISEEQTHLRTTLLAGLIKNLNHNLNHSNLKELNFYEFGHVYFPNSSFYPIEQKHVSGVKLTKSESLTTFRELKALIEDILTQTKTTWLKQNLIPDFKQPYSHPKNHLTWFNPKNKTPIISLFELHPKVQQNFDLDKFTVWFFEINYSALSELINLNKSFKPFSKFPSIEFDITIQINEKTPYKEIHKAINSASPEIINSIQLLYSYQGENIPKEKIAHTFKIILNSPEKTLTENDRQQTYQHILKNLQNL